MDAKWCQHGKTDQTYCADCHVIKQQSEIDRLTRAYEALKTNMEYFLTAESGHDRNWAAMALTEAKHIKDGDGEQG